MSSLHAGGTRQHFHCFPAQTQQHTVRFLFSLLLLWAAGGVLAQPTFNSGSTGALGAFEPKQSITVDLPPDGVLNYTTITIPAGVSVYFKRNARNTPVTMLATGDVKISGRIYLDGANGNSALGGEGGPSGFRGGNGGASYPGSVTANLAGTAGDGPGGGAGGPAVAGGGDFNSGGGGGFAIAGQAGRRGGPTPGAAGAAYGTATLLPLIGGSGGGGGSAGTGGVGGGGGGGGGALLIASSGKIIFELTGDGDYGIWASGGTGGCATGNAAGGSGGAGGAIRLVTNEISGNPYLAVAAGGVCSGDIRSNFGSYGYVRVEAYKRTEFRPRLFNSPFITSDAPNPAILASTSPQLRILSVGGKTPPANPIGSLYQEPDIQLDTSTAETLTVPVQVEARNMPVTTNIQVTLIRPDGTRPPPINASLTATTPTVATTTVNVTLNKGETVVIMASTTLNTALVMGVPKVLRGERVRKMEIATAFGGASEVTYITASGRRIKQTE